MDDALVKGLDAMNNTPPPLISQQEVITGNVYDKYETRNPIARYLMRGFLTAFTSMVEFSGAKDVHEVGCGEGHLSMILAQYAARVRASDISERVLEKARTLAEANNARISFKAASIYDLDPAKDAAELVVCCEVLEHLPDPERALQILCCLARPYLLISVPQEPVWRILNLLRAKYVGSLGNTPGHLQHWSKGAIINCVRRHARVVRVSTPFPWTMILSRTD